MQLVERVQHTSQGSLVLQLPLQCCNLGIALTNRQKDGHACQEIRPVWIDPSLHPNLISGRAIEE